MPVISKHPKMPLINRSKVILFSNIINRFDASVQRHCALSFKQPTFSSMKAVYPTLSLYFVPIIYSLLCYNIPGIKVHIHFVLPTPPTYRNLLYDG